MPVVHFSDPLTIIYFILFYFILFYFILFYFILFYFILFYFILFYFICIIFFFRREGEHWEEGGTLGRKRSILGGGSIRRVEYL